MANIWGDEKLEHIQYNATGLFVYLFVCLLPLQIRAAAGYAVKCAMPSEGRLGLEDRRATTCPVAEEHAKCY